eukprot:4961606-Pleurochrysis_carterae.AAC.5
MQGRSPASLASRYGCLRAQRRPHGHSSLAGAVGNDGGGEGGRACIRRHCARAQSTRVGRLSEAVLARPRGLWGACTRPAPPAPPVALTIARHL